MAFQRLTSSIKVLEGKKRRLPSNYGPKATDLYRVMLNQGVISVGGDGGSGVWALSALNACSLPEASPVGAPQVTSKGRCSKGAPALVTMTVTGMFFKLQNSLLVT